MRYIHNSNMPLIIIPSSISGKPGLPGRAGDKGDPGLVQPCAPGERGEKGAPGRSGRDGNSHAIRDKHNRYGKLSENLKITSYDGEGLSLRCLVGPLEMLLSNLIKQAIYTTSVAPRTPKSKVITDGPTDGPTDKHGGIYSRFVKTKKPVGRIVDHSRYC